MKNSTLPDTETRANPTKLWDFVKQDIKARFEANPDAAQQIIDMDEPARQMFRSELLKKYTENPQFSVVVKPESETPLRWDSFTSSYVGGKIPAKTRKLQTPEIEGMWSGWRALADAKEDSEIAEAAKKIKPLEKLSESERKSLLEIAEAEESPLAPHFKFDKKYLEAYSAAHDYFYKSARKMQADGDNWRNTWLGEAARGFGGMIVNPANLAANIARRNRGGVPFGNPQKLSDGEISQIAMDDALGELYPYVVGTKDFEDIRKNVPVGRKISRVAGEMLGYALPTAEGKAFELGMSAAAKLGAAKSLGGNVAKFAAGGAVASPLHTEVGSPVNARDDIGEQLVKNAALESASAAVFGAGMHAIGKGLEHARFSPLNPLYKTTAESNIDAVGQYISILDKRISNGAPVSPKERAFYDFVIDEAVQSKIPVGDVLSGFVAPRFTERTIRPWVREIPILSKIFPLEKRSYWKFDKTENVGEENPAGERFDAEGFKTKADEAVAQANPPQTVFPKIETETPAAREAKIAASPKFDNPDIPFWADESQRKFDSKDLFSEWLFAVDTGAQKTFDRFKYLPDRKKLWEDEYLPAYAKKYGAQVLDINATERAFTPQKEAEQARKIIDSIPDADEPLKLEAIGATETEYLSNAHLQYAAERGQEWAGEELVRRENAETLSSLDPDNVFSKLDNVGAKLPTPNSMSQKSGSLAAEMKSVYDALPNAIKRKYFSAANVKLDEVAESVGFESEADLISALGEEAARLANMTTPVQPAPIEVKAPPARPAETAPQQATIAQKKEMSAEAIKSELAMDARQWRESQLPNYTGDFLGDVMKSGGYKQAQLLPNPAREQIFALAFPDKGTFKIFNGQRSNSLKAFTKEKDFVNFLDRWFDASAEYARLALLPRADAYGLGTFREDYIKGMSSPKKVDGIALSKPLTPSEAAEQYDTLVRQIREDETPPEYINPDDALVELDTAPTKDSPLDAKPKDELAEFKRSKQVKDSFGDWETLAAIDEIQSMPAVFIAQHEALDKASIKEVFKNFGEVKNKKDGRIVVFPSASAGKIRRHKGFDSNTIIREFKPLFENSIPFISEKEEIKEGHKTHGNIESVEHYVNKFSANGNEYFIRFTVPIIRNNKGADNIHSSAISEVSIYKNGDSTLYPLNTAGSSSPSFIDDKLAKFLNSVNKKDVSKITDEKGEPLVVFHGTGKAFDKFDDKMSGGSGFHFTKNRNDAQRYASYGESPRIVRAFLSVKNPAPLDAVKKAYDAASGGNPQRAAHLYLKKLGYDGFVRGNDIVVFDAKQIIPIDNAPTAEGMSGGGKIVAPSAGATANSRYDVIPGIGEVSSARWFRPEKFADGSPNRAADADKAWLKLKNILGEPDAPDDSLSGSQIAEVSKQIDTWRKKIDPKMLRLPELVELVRNVLKDGSAPKVVRNISRVLRGNALGVYRAETGKPDSITVRSDLFKLVNAFENYRLAMQAADRTLIRAGHPKAPSLSLGEKLALLERENLTDAFKSVHGVLHKELTVKKKRDGFPVEILHVLAHESGHMVDYLAHVVNRGNILGRLAGFKEYLKHALPIFPGGKSINDQIRADLRRSAEIEASAKLQMPKMLVSWNAASRYSPHRVEAWRKMASELYEQKLAEFIDENNLLTDETAIKELSEVVKWWQDAPEVPKYFRKSSELYAEAFSCFLGNPEAFQRLAPNVFKAMVGYMRSKPQVWEKWNEIQARLGGQAENVASIRSQKLRQSWARERATAVAREKQIRDELKKYRGAIAKSALLAELQPYYDIAANVAKSDGLARGAYSRNIDQYRYRMSKQEAYLGEFKNDVLSKLKSAGLAFEDLAEYQFHRRVLSERSDIANPCGFSPSESKASLELLLAGMSKPQRKALVSAEALWRKLRNKYFINAIAKRKYFDDALNDKIVENIHYSPFSKARNGVPDDGIETLLESALGDGGAGIFKQFGNLGDIKNPAVAMLSKDLALISFVHRQEAIREFVGVMQRGAPSLIKDAETVYDKNIRGKKPVEPKSDEVAMVSYLENGQIRAFYVPLVYASAFNYKDPDIVSQVAQTMLRTVNAIPKKIFTQYNPGFWLRGFWRDMQTAAERMPAPKDKPMFLDRLFVAKEIAKQLPSAFKSSYSSFKGAPDKTAIDALNRGVIVSHREYMGARPNESEAVQTLKEFGIDASDIEARPRTKKEAMSRIILGYANAAQISERAMKIACLKYMDKNFPDMQEWEKSYWVRRVGGSPDFNERMNRSVAPWLDLVFLYYGPRIQGPTAAIDAFRKNTKQAVGGFLMFNLPRLLFRAAIATGIAGAVLSYMFGKKFGEAWEKMYHLIPERDRHTKDVLPIGSDSNGKTVYVSTPIEDNDRIVIQALSSMMDSTSSESIGKILLAELKSMNPLWKLGGDWLNYLGDTNPIDETTGREIIDPVEFDAGQTAVPMLKHTYNETIGSVLGRWKNESRIGEPDPTTLDTFLNLPVVKPILGSWIRVSDRGIADAARAASREYKEEQAKGTLVDREVVKKLHAGEQLNDAEQLRLANIVQNPSKLTAIKSKLITAAVKSQNTAMARALYESKSKAEAMLIVEKFREKRIITEAEYEGYKAQLQSNK